MKHVEELGDALVKLDVTELKYLGTYLKDKYGLEPAAAVVAQQPISTSEPVDDAPKYLALKVKAIGEKRLEIVKEHKALANISLIESKKIIDETDILFKNESIDRLKAVIEVFEKSSPGFIGEIVESSNPWE